MTQSVNFGEPYAIYMPPPQFVVLLLFIVQRVIIDELFTKITPPAIVGDWSCDSVLLLDIMQLVIVGEELLQNIPVQDCSMDGEQIAD